MDPDANPNANTNANTNATAPTRRRTMAVGGPTPSPTTPSPTTLSPTSEQQRPRGESTFVAGNVSSGEEGRERRRDTVNLGQGRGIPFATDQNGNPMPMGRGRGDSTGAVRGTPIMGAGRGRGEGAPMMGRRDTLTFIQPPVNDTSPTTTTTTTTTNTTTTTTTNEIPRQPVRRDTMFGNVQPTAQREQARGGVISPDLIQNDYVPVVPKPSPSTIVSPSSSTRERTGTVIGGRPEMKSTIPTTPTQPPSRPDNVSPERTPERPPQRPGQGPRTNNREPVPQREIPVSRAEWFALGETLIFHHHKLYKNSDWQQIDFKRYKIIPAKFGGPVALVKQKGNDQFSTEQSDSQVIDIFTSSARPLGRINAKDWYRLIVELGWNDVDQLVIILQNEVMIYNISGELDKRWKLEGNAIQARIWGTGFAVLTKELQFHATFDYEKPVCVKLRNPSIQAPPTVWAIIEPQLSADGNLEIILCTSFGGIMVLSEKNRIDISVSVGLCSHISVSPSGKIIAFYTEKGNLWILTSDFSTELTNFLTRAPSAPLQLEWCGGDAVACYWETQMEHLVLMIGPDASYKALRFDQPLVITSECDGMRIIGQGESSFITKASKSQQLVWSPIPNAASMLLEASDFFHNQSSPKSDDILRKIKLEMTAAVQVLVDAAGYEFSIDKQQDLLMAAGFGKAMDEEVRAPALEPMAKIVRIMNTIRTEEIGIPLSIGQYQVLTPQILINRLLNRNLHQLSFEICNYLGLKSDVVLVHWATRKVTTKLNDDQILFQIKEKTKETPGISFSAVAYAAFQNNRAQLATRLLDEEACAADQVPLLISMGKQNLALEKACQAGDTDLIQLALLVLHSKLTQADFYALLRGHSEAQCIWEIYCRDTNREELLSMYRAGGGNAHLAKEEVVNAFMCEDLDQRHEHLKTAGSLYKKIDKFAYHETKDQISLLVIQRELEITLNGNKFVGSSLSNTLYRCIILGAEKKAKAIRTQFLVPNKRWWWIKMRAYAASGKWDSLRRFSEQESPVGYRPFVEVCLEFKNELEAIPYIKMVKDEVERVKLYIRVNKWMEAIETVEHFRGDAVEIIAYMKAKCNQAAFKIKLEELEAKYNNGEIGTFLGALGVPQIQTKLFGIDINT